MKTFEMIKFGRTLTDRDYGKNIAATLSKETSFPLVLDFKDVMALGSSCGDEICNAIAPKQGNQVSVINANQAIQSCLKLVAEDLKITLHFM